MLLPIGTVRSGTQASELHTLVISIVVLREAGTLRLLKERTGLYLWQFEVNMYTERMLISRLIGLVHNRSVCFFEAPLDLMT